MTVYISGKITGTTDYMERFEAAEKKLVGKGYDAINPAKRNAEFPPGTAWETYMRSCITMLMGADAIYMMRGWRRSAGAVLEHQIATSLGMVIINEGGFYGE